MTELTTYINTFLLTGAVAQEAGGVELHQAGCMLSKGIAISCTGRKNVVNQLNEQP